MLDLRSLNFFVEVAKRLNLTQAASALHISQPALSRQLQALESELGLTLFTRTAKRLVLTAAGTDLLERSAALIDQANHLVARATSLRLDQSGLIRIAASPHTIESFLPSVMMAFRERFPAIDTSLLEGANDTLIELICSGAADISIAAPNEDETLDSQPLFWASLAVIVPDSSPLVGYTHVEIEQLAHQPLLQLRKGFLTRRIFDRACAQAGVKVRSVLESDSAYALIALAKAGYGCAVVSSTALAHSAASAIPLTLAGTPIRHAVSAVWQKKTPSNPWTAAFVNLLIEHLRNPNIAPHLERHPALASHTDTHSSLMFASLTSLAQRIPSSAKNLVKSSGVPPSVKA
jgi:DNA-binding transcriptional LysR family regulator